MLYCAVNNCHNYLRKVSSFALPKDNAVRCKWLEFAGIDENTIINAKMRICMEHFEKKYFKTLYPRPLLMPNSVPTINANKKKRTVEKNWNVSIVKNETLETINTDAEEKESNSVNEMKEISANSAETLKVPENLVTQVDHKMIDISLRNVNSEKDKIAEILSTDAEEKEMNSVNEIKEISENSTETLKVEQKLVPTVELECKKIKTITVTSKNFRSFTLYNLGDCTLKMQFDQLP